MPNPAEIRKKAAEKALADYKKKSASKKQRMSEGLMPKKMEATAPKKEKSEDDDDDEESKPKPGSGERFKKLSGELKAKGAKDPKALAAYIGRKKYGPVRMKKMAAAGKKKG